jgi:hypothetical protein
MIKRVSIFIILLCLVILVTNKANAGSSLDYGTVPGTPPIGSVNWVAWNNNDMDSNPYPYEVLTEDSNNPGFGTNQGYQNFGGDSNPKWLLQVSQFTNPPRNNRDYLTVLLGGLGIYSGQGWCSYFQWTSGQSETNHGQATVVTPFGACPTMLQGSLNGNLKTINWSDPNGALGNKYLIYRSQNGSGADNGASNGRYLFTSLFTATNSEPYSYVDDTGGFPSWHIVIPADPNTNAIIGCHSEESSPTVVRLSNFNASVSSNPSYWLIFVGLGVIGVTTIGLIINYKRRGLH